MNRVKRLVLIVFALSHAAASGQSPGGEPIPPGVERSYARGLQFLLKSQKEDGSWPQRYGSEPAVVGFCVLALLAHGDDPNFGPSATGIRRAIDFILKAQNRENGYIGSSMYNHGFATLALAESYGVVDDPRLGPALRKAVDLILSSQADNPFGAWRYSPGSRDADTTVSGAQIVALFAARNAGIGVPQPALEKALRFLRECQSADGGIGYTNASDSNPARTAIGVVVMALAHQQETASFKAAAAYLRVTPPEEHQYFHYYLYYAAQAAFRMPAQEWEIWNAANARKLAASQLPDGSWESSLAPAFTTAASLLSLALNYRYLPIYER